MTKSNFRNIYGIQYGTSGWQENILQLQPA